MNLFETIKAAVTVRQAAEHYGLKVSRNNMVCCPFHNDRHSQPEAERGLLLLLRLWSKRDVIDFVARLYDLTSLQAAQKLAYDFGIDPTSRLLWLRCKTEISNGKGVPERRTALSSGIVRLSAPSERWKVQYAPKTPEETIDDRFVEACQMLDYIEYLTDILTFAELEVRVKAVDMLRKEGTIDGLEERLKRLDKEVATRNETEIG